MLQKGGPILTGHLNSIMLYLQGIYKSKGFWEGRCQKLNRWCMVAACPYGVLQVGPGHGTGPQ